MVQFYASISDAWKMKFSRGNTVHDYCDWYGVTCYRGVVFKLRYYNKKYGNFDMQALLSTVERVFVINVYVVGRSMHSRRAHSHGELRVNNMRFDRLFGSANLRTLPRNLILLDLSSNALIGPIDLSNNRIRQSVILHDILPPTLISYADETNHIGKICAVYPDMAVEDKTVFGTVRTQKIR